MQVLFVENEGDRAVLVTDKLGSRNCNVVVAKGAIEAAALVQLRSFDLALISGMNSLFPASSLIQRLRNTNTPYAYLIPKESRHRYKDGQPTVTVEDLDNGALDKLAREAVAV